MAFYECSSGGKSKEKKIMEITNAVHTSTNDTFDISALFPTKYTEFTRDDFIISLTGCSTTSTSALTGDGRNFGSYNASTGIFTTTKNVPNYRDSQRFYASYRIYLIYEE